jgi:hypothetical protein
MGPVVGTGGLAMIISPSGLGVDHDADPADFHAAGGGAAFSIPSGLAS